MAYNLLCPQLFTIMAEVVSDSKARVSALPDVCNKQETYTNEMSSIDRKYDDQQ